MPHPKQGYHLKDGTRVPGTTTIISKCKESGGLIHWAWNLGMQGKDYRAERDKAADAGTLAHALVEAHIGGDTAPPEATTNPKAVAAFQAYLSWEAATKLEIVDQEMSLVSEAYRYGGTPDAIGYLDGKLCLLDWKTSNSVYPDYLIQLAAYKQLVEENDIATIDGGFHLLRFAKEEGDFAHHFFPDLSLAWAAFVKMRGLYDDMAALKKRVR